MSDLYSNSSNEMFVLSLLKKFCVYLEFYKFPAIFSGKSLNYASVFHVHFFFEKKTLLLDRLLRHLIGLEGSNNF